MSEPTDLAPFFARVPLLAGADPAATRRLGGLTNINHLVDVGGERFVLRVPGFGTADYIDRAAEEVAARSAASAGVNAEVVFFDAADGLMVTRYLEATTTMDPARFRDLAAVSRAGHALRRLHGTAAPFATDFRPFELIDEYKVLLAARGAALPDAYEDTEREAGAMRAALARNPVALVPSHCDPLCENFLDTSTQMFLIDYEYAGNNDPMWDLGDLSVEGGFTDEQDAALLCAYVGGEPSEVQASRMVIAKALCDLLWTLWGVIQHVDHNPVDDFWAYAVNRFERCRRLMDSDWFATRLAALG